jgi:hypothetical protein
VLVIRTKQKKSSGGVLVPIFLGRFRHRDSDLLTREDVDAASEMDLASETTVRHKRLYRPLHLTQEPEALPVVNQAAKVLGLSIHPMSLRPPKRKEQWVDEAREFRRWFSRELPRFARQPIECGPPVSLKVFSFSSQRDLPEQAASVASFFSHVGTPSRFTIISDGSHRRESIELLRALHPSVEVALWSDVAQPTLPSGVRRYADRFPMGKKLAAIISLSASPPLLYADSDILFFPAATELALLTSATETHPRYLLDHKQAFDRPILGEESPDAPVNAGLFFLFKPVDWELAVRSLNRTDLSHPHLAEQTVVHLTMRRAGAQPFDPARYVVTKDDQYLAGDRFPLPDTVLRHYIRPVRDKFWLTARSAIQQAYGGCGDAKS